MYKLAKIILCFLIFSTLIRGHMSYATTIPQVAIERSSAYETQMAIEDYVGTWVGEVAGEHAEMAIWLIQKGLKPFLGGYIIFHGSKCIQKIDGQTTSMLNYDELSRNIENPLSKDVYKHAYLMGSRFPIRELRNNGCSRLAARSNIADKRFNSYLAGGSPGESIKLSYFIKAKYEEVPYALATAEMSRGKASQLMQEMLRKGYGFAMYETAAPSPPELKILNSLFD